MACGVGVCGLGMCGNGLGRGQGDLVGLAEPEEEEQVGGVGTAGLEVCVCVC